MTVIHFSHYTVVNILSLYIGTSYSDVYYYILGVYVPLYTGSICANMYTAPLTASPLGCTTLARKLYIGALTHRLQSLIREPPTERGLLSLPHGLSVRAVGSAPVDVPVVQRGGGIDGASFFCCNCCFMIPLLLCCCCVFSCFAGATATSLLLICFG